MTYRIILLLTVFWSSFGSILYGQDIEDYVSKYTSENGQAYMQPLADVFGANLNSGIFRSAHVRKSGFHLSINLVGQMAILGDQQREFTATTEEPFTPTTSVQAPTIFGESEGPSVEGVGGTRYIFPGGLNFTRFPMVVPHLTIGSIYGTELLLRYISLDVDETIGRVELTGYGARHNLDQYLQQMPLNLAVSYFRQTYDVGDIVSATAQSIGIQAGKTFNILNVYSGMAFESSTMDISYQYEGDTGNEEISFELESKNSFRFLLGIGMNLSIFHLYADYNFSNVNVLSVGVGFGK
ncbi:hypothetical protein GF407_01670 [candidate division KSB1 bacterium]|nr:hypothetical protein [candidate division KSB1 bacterium]